MRRAFFVCLILFLLPLASSAWMGPLLGSGVGQSASGCSTPTGNVMYESFGDDSTACTSGGTEACVNTWTVENGDSQTFKVELPGSPPPGSCTYGLLSDTANESSERISLDVGDAISYETSTDMVFSVYIESSTTVDVNGNIVIVAIGSTNSGATNYCANLRLFNAAGQMQMFVYGTAGSDKVNISEDTWYTIKIHMDATAANSYWQINGGSQTSFERADQNKEYVVVGSIGNEGATESTKFYVGYLYVDNP